MLTRDQALQNLNLPPEATEEEIERGYQRMVRRYPPEHHPDRFRLIDESYRTLTSLAFVVERIFSGPDQEHEANLVSQVAGLSLVADEQAVAQGTAALWRMLLCDALWPEQPLLHRERV